MNCHCDNCDWTGPESEMVFDLSEIPNLAERLDPGGEVPAGECPQCDALAYLVKESAAVLPAGGNPATPPRIVILVDGGSVQEVLCSDAATRVEILDCDNADTPEDRTVLDLQWDKAQAELHSVPLR